MMSQPIDLDSARRAMDAKTKPLGALGRIEALGIRLAMLQNTLSPSLERARICVFGADHGIADEGVSAYPRAVTGEMMRNFDRGGAAINVIAAANGLDVEVIDVGVDADLAGLSRVRHERVRASSRNFAREAAMTEDELIAALAVGAAAAQRAKDAGARAIGLGEMGIANTTSAAALLSALTGYSADLTVGRGTGIDDAALAHKREVVDAAARMHFNGQRPTGRDALRCVGGLEIAAIAGAAHEGARLGLAVVADGFISTVGVLCALHIAHDSSDNSVELAGALFFAHRSAERGHGLAMEACGAFDGCDAAPLLDLGLRLGEGTGAALALPLLRAAAAVMRDMATFAEAGVSAGEHADQHSVEADASTA
jgi:nicotinate-nucleotide--dimethylbenzimidazole phosphoribosyltransferase